MQVFDAQSIELNLFRPYILEASAGTGKTFSIQHLVARLLLQPSPEKGEALTLDQILIVTFTRAATQELRGRVEGHLRAVLKALKKQDLLTFPYLQLISCFRSAQKKIELALLGFERAHIFTIHSFCVRMLSEYQGIPLTFNEQEGLSKSLVGQVLKDFLRTELSEERYHPYQMQVLFGSQDLVDLTRKVWRILQKQEKIIFYPSYKEWKVVFIEKWKTLKEEWTPSSEEIWQYFYALAPFYNKLRKKGGDYHSHILRQVDFFASLWEKEKWEESDFLQLFKEGIPFIQFFQEENLNARKKKELPESSALPLSRFTNAVEKELQPLLNQATEEMILLTRLSHDCQELLENRMQIKQTFPPDHFIKQLVDLLEDSKIREEIQQRFGCIIIDEFQDTDPLQWSLFQQLRNDSPSFPLYLVGDPKQSIYRFRKADIYTYLDAIHLLGKEALASLSTNWRSSRSLIHALNYLLDETRVPAWIPLPQVNSHLPFHPVETPPEVGDLPYDDGKGAIHCLVAEEIKKTRGGSPSKLLEEEILFPWIAREICGLYEENQVALREIAILVRDRYQAQRLYRYLGRKNIPSVCPRAEFVTDFPVIEAMECFLKVLENPKNTARLRRLLLSPLFGWNHQQLSELTEENNELFGYFYSLHRELKRKGIAAVLQKISLLIEPDLVTKERGDAFLRAWRQLCEFLIEEENDQGKQPEKWISFVRSLSELDSEECSQLQIPQDHHQQSVQILTIHKSKGLEFDVVFALGVIYPTKVRQELIPVTENGTTYLIPSEERPKEKELHYQELDAEKMRQLYVTLTRARHRVYLPVTFPLSSVEMGSPSPLHLFLTRLLTSHTLSSKEVYQHFKNLSVESCLDFLKKSSQEISLTYEHVGEAMESPYFEREVAIELSSLSSPPKTQFTSRLLQSFSSLISGNEQEVTASYMKKEESDEKTVHTLPAGSATGTLLHLLLEKVDFSSFAKQESHEFLLPWVQGYLENHSLKGWEQVIAEILFHTLKTPLKTPQGTIELCHLPKEQLWKEMEFTYPIFSKGLIEEVQVFPGYVKGVIDLFFQWKGNYFILDWKSNYLGQDITCYDLKTMEQSMAKHCYSLQSTLYADAIKKYLGGKRGKFAGVFYIFLRGKSLNTPQYGTYFIPSY